MKIKEKTILIIFAVIFILISIGSTFLVGYIANTHPGEWWSIPVGLLLIFWGSIGGIIGAILFFYLASKMEK